MGWRKGHSCVEGLLCAWSWMRCLQADFIGQTAVGPLYPTDVCMCVSGVDVCVSEIGQYSGLGPKSSPDFYGMTLYNTGTLLPLPEP